MDSAKKIKLWERQTCLQKFVPPADRHCRSWFKANNEAWTANKLNCRLLWIFFRLSVPLVAEEIASLRCSSWTNVNHGISCPVFVNDLSRFPRRIRKKEISFQVEKSARYRTRSLTEHKFDSARRPREHFNRSTKTICLALSASYFPAWLF